MLAVGMKKERRENPEKKNLKGREALPLRSLGNSSHVMVIGELSRNRECGHRGGT